MKTTKEGRAKMRKFAALKALHSNRAFNPRYALDLIADVEDAVRLLGETREALARLLDIKEPTQRKFMAAWGAATLNLEAVRDRLDAFLKEPKS